MKDFVKNTIFVEIARNIYLKASQENWTIPIIVCGVCILALAGYCIDNPYTSGKDFKAKMEQLLEFMKQIYIEQILEDLTSKNRLNKTRLQALEKNVRIENQRIIRNYNRNNFQIMDNAYQPYHVKEYNSLRDNYRRTNSSDPRIDTNNTNNGGDGRGNNDARSANNPGARMDNYNAKSVNSHDDSIDYYSANIYDSMDYYCANSFDAWIDSNSAKRAKSYDDSRNNYSASQFI